MPRTVDEYIARSNVLALAIVDGNERPYEAGLKLMALGTDAALDHWDMGQPLLLMWAALTDRVDAPAGWGGSDEPDKEDKASDEMIRAAREWLTVSSDEEARRTYFDRWVYEECGYRRPGEGDR